MKNKLILFLSLIAFISSCTSGDTDGTLAIDSTKINNVDTVAPVKIDTTPVTVESTKLSYNAEDKINLLLFEKFSLGISYE